MRKEGWRTSFVHRIIVGALTSIMILVGSSTVMAEDVAEEKVAIIMATQSSTNEVTNVLAEIEQEIYYFLRDNYRKIDLEDYQYTEDEVRRMVDNIFMYDPALWLALSERAGNNTVFTCTTGMENNSQYVAYMLICTGPENNGTDEELDVLYEKCQQIVEAQQINPVSYHKAKDKALQSVNEKMTDVEKVMALHDYLIANTYYDYDNYLAGTIPSASYTAYGALALKSAVCSGYTDAMDILMKAVGIKCDRVSSDTMNHTWNVVKLEGEWYHLDATWDDPCEGSKEVFTGNESRRSFLLNNQEIMKMGHSGWSPTVSSASTKYSLLFRPALLSKYSRIGHYWFDGSNLTDLYGKQVDQLQTKSFVVDRQRGFIIYQSGQTIRVRNCWDNKDTVIYALSEAQKGTSYPSEAAVTRIASYDAVTQKVTYEYQKYNVSHVAQTERGECPLTIQIPLQSILLQENKVRVLRGKEVVLGLTVTPGDTTATNSIQWTSSNPQVVSVDNSGKATAKSLEKRQLLCQQRERKQLVRY